MSVMSVTANNSGCGKGNNDTEGDFYSFLGVNRLLYFCFVYLFFRCGHFGGIWRSWLRHCSTKHKVAGSIPDGVMEFFIDIIFSAALWQLDWQSL
jgi:hypothetical protein